MRSGAKFTIYLAMCVAGHLHAFLMLIIYRSPADVVTPQAALTCDWCRLRRWSIWMYGLTSKEVLICSCICGRYINGATQVINKAVLHLFLTVTGSSKLKVGDYILCSWIQFSFGFNTIQMFVCHCVRNEVTNSSVVVAQVRLWNHNCIRIMLDRARWMHVS